MTNIRICSSPHVHLVPLIASFILAIVLLIVATVPLHDGSYLVFHLANPTRTTATLFSMQFAIPQTKRLWVQAEQSPLATTWIVVESILVLILCLTVFLLDLRRWLSGRNSRDRALSIRLREMGIHREIPPGRSEQSEKQSNIVFQTVTGVLGLALIVPLGILCANAAWERSVKYKDPVTGALYVSQRSKSTVRHIDLRLVLCLAFGWLLFVSLVLQTLVAFMTRRGGGG